MWFDVDMEWVSLGISLLALVLAFFADRRSRRTFQRESKAALHREVEFKIIETKRDGRKAKITVANIGTETPRSVEVDPSSISYAAWDGLMFWVTVPPNEPIELRYSEGALSLDSITLTWSGPGTGKQSIIIPQTSPESV